VKVTMLGTLPPLKGNAYYCWGMATALAGRIPVEFYSFRKLYPEKVYPGGTRDRDPLFRVEGVPGLEVHRTLTYYNPLTWLACGWRAAGEVVHAQWWSKPVAPVWLTALSILRCRRRPVLLTVHNVTFHEKRSFDRGIARAVFSLADAFCVHCPDNREELARFMGIGPEKIHVIPMPVHDMYRDAPVSKEDARVELGLPPDALVLLLFGNLRPYKGEEVCLRAVAALPESLRHRILVVVAGQQWGDTDYFTRLIAGLGLEAQVKRFLNYIPMSRVKYYFEAADLVVLPYTHFSAQSGVGTIGLAFGKPLLVTRVGGLPALVRRPEAIAEPDDIHSLAERLAHVLTEPGLLAQMADDSRRVAAERTWDAAAERTLEIYRSLLSG